MYLRNGIREGRHYQVDPTTGCWNWLLSVDIGGYGQINHRGLNRAAHRTIWENTHGPILHGLCVCHKCDNRRCINPAHLFLGTQKQNLHDAKQKGRTSPPPRNVHLVGERCPWVKLTDNQVCEIRRLLKLGKESQRAIAKTFGVSQTHISEISTSKQRKTG